jgi:hypothetical protein
MVFVANLKIDFWLETLSTQTGLPVIERQRSQGCVV